MTSSIIPCFISGNLEEVVMKTTLLMLAFLGIETVWANDPCTGVVVTGSFDCNIPNTDAKRSYKLYAGAGETDKIAWCLTKFEAGTRETIQVPEPIRYGDTTIVTQVSKSGLVHLYGHKDQSVIEFNFAPSSPRRSWNTNGPKTSYACEWNIF